MKTTNINEGPFQGETINNASKGENIYAFQSEVNTGIQTEKIREFLSVPGMINLSGRQRGIIGSCFGEDFLL
jgi:hypothetical protein